MSYFKNDPVQKLLFSKVLDRFFLCESQQICTFTDFYDPVSCEKFKEALPCKDIIIRIFGGAPDCERRMLGFAPFADDLTDDVFPIQPLRILFNIKFHKPPRHQDLLGSILGLGIDRSRVGDILLFEDHANVFVHSEIAGYILTQLEKAGKTPVKVEPAPPLEEYDRPVLDEKTVTVASLRLDAVISASFRVSRGEASALIEGEKVFVNWKPLTEPAKTVCENDMVTLRGQGRVRIAGIEGKTKKDRIRLRIAVY